MNIKTKRLSQSLLASTLLVVMTVGLIWSCQENEEQIEFPYGSDAHGGMAAEDSEMTKNNRAGRTATTFNEEVGSSITDEIARTWKANYKAKYPNGVESHFFGRKAFEMLLAQKNAVGISIHYAINDAGTAQLLLVGVDADGKTLLKNSARSTGGRSAEEGVGYLDMSVLCPPTCGSY
jgi:hypothetical protein